MTTTTRPAAVVLLLLVPDGRLLLAAGELLMLRPDRMEAAAAAQAWFAAGGVLWAAAARRPRSPAVPTWGRPVTLLAAALPLVYAVPRAVWAAGNLVWLPWGVTLGLAMWAYRRRTAERGNADRFAGSGQGRFRRRMKLSPKSVSVERTST
ncbi:hypothetical protein AB0J72_18250 [Dactylosporangium sp. NPDC049742]|uniref:hypothetical protein n=1 Tax=Dactylosporangium sp. NPDC049742 TaxID=3154737 RepID=UPI00341D477C